jgi:SNF2 family DNA or RNA helicase
MRTTPLEHQKKIQPVICDADYYGLLWEQGLGKTWAISWLLEKDNPAKALIMSPNNVTEVWVEELAKHTEISPKKIKILTGSKEKRIKLLNTEARIYIINYEGLRTIFKELYTIPWDIIVADESQRIKNHQALQTRAATALAQKARKRFILSGTPLLNSYLDIFSQFLFLDLGKRFGGNFYAFRNKYFFDENAHRWRGDFPMWKIKPGSEKEIKEKIASCCHRLEIDGCLLKLPPKIFQNEYVYLPKEQQKCYKELASEFITSIENEPVTAQVMLTRLLRFRQVTSGFLKTEDGKIKAFKENPKLEAVLDLAERILPIGPDGKWLNKNKLVIWAFFRHDIELLAEKLKKYNPVFKYGGVKEPVHRTFQEDDNCKIFIGQPRSSGTGITLTKGNYSLRYSYDFSSEDKQQSDARTRRKGSEIHKVITYITIKARHTIDELTLKNLSDKKEMADGVMTFIKSFQEGKS